MALDPESLLFSLAAIIGLGYLGSYLFEKTSVPDVLLLVGLGVLLGPVTGILDPAVFNAMAPVVGTFTLLVILFDGGLSLKIKDLVRGLGRASILALVGWIVTVALVGVLMWGIYGWDIKQGLLLGAILGGSSSIVVIPLLAKARASEDARVALSLESALTDVLCVVGALTLVDIILAGTVDAQATASDIAAQFSVAIILGLGAGLAWGVLWKVLEKGNYAYMITLAAMLGLHAGVEALGGSGPIAVLAFGILLGNRVALLKGKVSKAWERGGEMRRFQQEITFLIRAFFFAFLGVILDLSIFTRSAFLVGALIVLGCILVARFAAVKLATVGTSKLDDDQNMLMIMMPRGLAAAALAGIPIQQGVVGTEDFVGYAFMLIVLTNVIVTVGVFAFGRGKGGGKEKKATPA